MEKEKRRGLQLGLLSIHQGSAILLGTVCTNSQPLLLCQDAALACLCACSQSRLRLGYQLWGLIRAVCHSFANLAFFLVDFLGLKAERENMTSGTFGLLRFALNWIQFYSYLSPTFFALSNSWENLTLPEFIEKCNLFLITWIKTLSHDFK